MEYRTYIDESGNTGDNLLDPNQKLFVLAAVSVPNDKEDTIVQKIQTEFDQVKEIGETEIKAARWVKATKKNKKLKDIIGFMIDNGCSLSAIILEKRYMVAALIVDNFLDGAYNENEDYTWCNDKQEKKAAAQYFYDVLDDKDINTIGLVFINPTLDGFHNALEKLISKTKDPRYLAVLNGCHVEELFNVEYDCSNNTAETGAHVLHSPNYTAFCTLGIMVARTCRSKETKTNVIFDSCKLCDKAYAHIFEVFQNMQANQLVEEWTGLFPWKSIIDTFKVDNSKNSFLLQTADVLATSILKTVEKLHNENKLNEYDGFVIDLIRDLLLKDGFWYVVSSQLLNRLVMELRKSPHPIVRGEVKDVDSLRNNARVEYSLYKQILECKDDGFQLQEDGSFKCSVTIQSSFLGYEKVVAFTDKTIVKDFAL